MPHAINEEDLERELLAFRASGETQVNNKLATILLDLAWTIPGHYGEEWREDCVQVAAIHLCEKVAPKWEPKHGRAYNYFYTAACFAAMKEYRKQQSQRRACVAAYNLYEDREGEVDGSDALLEVMAKGKKNRVRKRIEVPAWEYALSADLKRKLRLTRTLRVVLEAKRRDAFIYPYKPQPGIAGKTQLGGLLGYGESRKKYEYPHPRDIPLERAQ